MRHSACKAGTVGVTGMERGATLIVVLLLLIVVLLLGVGASQIAVQGEKSSRNDRDRQIAFQAAEAALLDAETDIEASPDALRSRSHLFSADGIAGFPQTMESFCAAGEANVFLGLCRYAENEDAAWRHVDFLGAGATSTHSVPYGRFTGQVFPVGAGPLPARLPRYIVEMMPDRKPGMAADESAYVYRITAVGFGVRETTQVALQTIYRKASR